MKAKENRGDIMGLFDKVKNLFTEEVEEEIKPVKKETRYVEPPAPKVVPKEEVKPPVKEEVKPDPVPTKEEKFVFFSDDDFKDLEKPKIEPKKVENNLRKNLLIKVLFLKLNQNLKKNLNLLLSYLLFMVC